MNSLDPYWREQRRQMEVNALRRANGLPPVGRYEPTDEEVAEAWASLIPVWIVMGALIAFLIVYSLVRMALDVV